MKYQPDFPSRFSNLRHAQEFLGEFFDWYNNHHRHEGIAMLTPADVYFGRSNEVLQKRQEALDMAFEAHPKRFVKRKPRVARLPPVVCINRPDEEARPSATSTEKLSIAAGTDVSPPSPAANDTKATAAKPTHRSESAWREIQIEGSF